MEVIEENNLGIVIEPSASLILSSVRKLYKDQNEHIISILKYAREHPYLSIKDYLKMAEDRKYVSLNSHETSEQL